MVSLISVAVLVIFLLAVMPAWPYSRDWGYAPSGGVGAVLAIVLAVVLLTGLR
jgi:hypothetical protein